MVNAQEYLDQNYPPELRESLKFLNLSSKNLEGALDLTEFPNLTTLICDKNSITDLDLKNLTNLDGLYCSENRLNSLDLSRNQKLTILFTEKNELTALDLSNNTKLRKIRVGGNKIKSELNIFKDLVDLYQLSLSVAVVDSDLRVKGWKWENKFFGSLKPLSNLKELVVLNISFQTDLAADLEYLPIYYKLKRFFCLGTDFLDIDCKEFCPSWVKDKEYDCINELMRWQLSRLEVLYNACPELFMDVQWVKKLEGEIKSLISSNKLNNKDRLLWRKKTFIVTSILLVSILVNIILILYIFMKQVKKILSKKTTQDNKK